MAGDDTIEGFNEKISDSANFSAKEFIKSAQEMSKAANEMTRAFAGSRARVGEMMTAVSEAAPRMQRLGASFQETTTAMLDIAEATKKQTLASSDSVAKLYATTKVIGVDIKSIVNDFTDVGIQFGVIGGELEKSVSTVSDLGLNTQAIMSQVVSNASKLNQFNFEGGVQGLTKMAARAAMLRSDMRETFQFAEEVMDPENAIKMASTFQRLGVSVGNLADPFALMNASINDPGALQDSIAKAAQAYTTFDEKTKTFKINPQGMLTLRQMAKETGMSYDNLSKMGLAAAELDKRLSQISPSLKFNDESDKQFLSNLSEMDASGEYVVKIRDASGADATKKLSEVTQQEFDNLIKEQKEAPKTMEDIARAGMKTSDIIANDVSAIKQAVVRGAVSTSVVKDNMESFRKTITIPTGVVSDKLGNSQIFNKEFEKASNAVRDAVSEMIQGKKSTADVFKELGNKFSDQGADVKKTLTSITSQVYNNLKDKNLGYKSGEIGKMSNAAMSKLKELVEGKSEKPKSGVTDATTKAAKDARSEAVSLRGTEGLNKSTNPNQTLTSAVEQNIEYSHTGTVTFKIDAPSNIDTKSLQAFVNTTEFQQAVYKAWQSVKNEKTK